MARPSGATTKRTMAKKRKKKQPTIKKMCVSCPAESANKSRIHFYKTNSDLYPDGLLPICKTCIKDRCLDAETNEIKLDEFKSILRQFDKPYIEKVYQASVKEYAKKFPLGEDFRSDISKASIIGYYFKTIITLSQYKDLNWEQGLKYESTFGDSPENRLLMKKTEDAVNGRNSILYYLEDDEFEVTQDIIRLFGEGYNKSEYRAMWKKYEFLKTSYPDITNLHSEALLTYIRLKVKEEMATSRGDVSEAEKWNRAATTAAEKAKINPSQLRKSDLQGGLNSFSELFQAVEQAVDIIPILPKFKYRPNDAIDFNIWCLINYLRRLEGKPLCEYEDVYKFYDERKRDYVEQYGDPYGIFAGDTTEKNRENIQKFITLPSDYSDSSEDGSIEGDFDG